MFGKTALASLALAAAVSAQQAGTLVPEVHPSMAMKTCTSGGTCTTKNTKIVLDSNWRWLHSKSGSTNCYTGNSWDSTLCADPKVCAQNCAMEGADYPGTYGITVNNNELTLKFIQGANIGSRVYLMADDSNYQMFNLKNNEFTFDVDMSNLPCGLNGALYFSQMEQDGGMAKHAGNNAGAKYGTGYCDAQCPHDIKFINGEANVIDWNASEQDPNAGSGKYGTCCTEMDIWEANKFANALTPHACKGNGLIRCEGIDCGDAGERYDGICDKDGCDFNAYRMGDKDFIGPGKTVDTNKKITVVTQFITVDGTNSGALKSMKRFYVQDGVTFAQTMTNMPGVTQTNEITEEFCNQQKSVFGDNNYWSTLNGMDGFSDALDVPMVLSMSIWDDHSAHMNWLDSTYPNDGTAPGDVRGPCNPLDGVPETVEAAHPGATVKFSNIKFGPIGSTFNSGGTGPNPSTTAKPPTSTVKPPTSTANPTPTQGPTVPKWGQCGGIGYTGPTQCAAGSTCRVNNQWYSQCL
ncbi:hypothetical protein V493_06949 [Pseudogymnoascus sp. VKM F-4281 (FW-2241)]|nr:hypothetical protein V493_06949 [Pseudogymnoascus sp. VKM F-4281 (FW-2241)]